MASEISLEEYPFEDCLGPEKATIVRHLIQLARTGSPPQDAKRIAEKNRKQRVHVHTALGELKRLGIAKSDGDRPEKWTLVDEAELPDRLLQAKKEKVDKKKEELENEYNKLVATIENLKARRASPRQSESNSALLLQSKTEMYEILRESLNLLGRDDSVLCQTSSLSHWALERRKGSEDEFRFLSLFRKRLLKSEIKAGVYVLPVEDHLENMRKPLSSANKKLISTLYSSLRKVPNLVMVNSEAINIASPLEVVVFGKRRVVFGLTDDTGVLSRGFMVDGSASALLEEEKFLKLFGEAKQKVLFNYLDDLLVAEKARVPKESKVLRKLVEHAESKTGAVVNPEYWETARRTIVGSLERDVEYDLLRDYLMSKLDAVI